MQILTLLRQSIPLLTFAMGMTAWRIFPSHFEALHFQSKALFTFSLSLTTLSCLLLPLGARLMEILKIIVYGLFLITFILTLEPFYSTFLEGRSIYSKLIAFYHPDKAMGMVFSWAQRRLSTQYELYGIWLGFTAIPVLLLCYFFHLLCLVPGRRLFLDRSYRVKDGPWVAGFLDSHKERELLKNNTGLPLGVPFQESGTKGKILRYLPNPNKGWLSGHHVVISGSQGGKGVSCVLPTILDHGGPVAVLDIKGELFAMTQKDRQKKGRKIVILNPFNVVEENKWHWNPLEYIRPEEFERDSRIIIEGLLEPETPYNQHFYKIAADILQVTLEVILHTMPKGDFNLNTLYDFVCGPEFINRLKIWIKHPGFLDGRPAKMATTILSAGEEERGSFFTTIKRNLSWIGYEKNKVFLQPSKDESDSDNSNTDIDTNAYTHTFSFDELLDNKIDLFCVIPLDMIETMSGFLRLFTNIVLGTVIRQSGYKNPKEKILLMLDEFPRLGAMRQLINIVTVAAGAGIEAFMVAQDKSSIESVWGKETDVIFGSSATVRIFNLGRTDSSTASWASSLMGDRTIVTRTNAAREYGDFLKGAGSESVSQMKEKLLTAPQIQELGDTKMLCFLRGQQPLLLERIISHKHPYYKNRLSPNPTLLDF
ncbi:MAG: type IV secretory system conjugative DNA transfer family protein [Alphaproteobacteria bacterium]|nr:type IV secretory system conjugative DNA transfer family protein [Alphaproteobacteria bacterium]